MRPQVLRWDFFNYRKNATCGCRFHPSTPWSMWVVCKSEECYSKLSKGHTFSSSFTPRGALLGYRLRFQDLSSPLSSFTCPILRMLHVHSPTDTFEVSKSSGTLGSKILGASAGCTVAFAITQRFHGGCGFWCSAFGSDSWVPGCR